MAGHQSNPYSSTSKTTSWYPGNGEASIGVPPGYQRAAGSERNALERLETSAQPRCLRRSRRCRSTNSPVASTLAETGASRAVSRNSAKGRGCVASRSRAVETGIAWAPARTAVGPIQSRPAAVSACFGNRRTLACVRQAPRVGPCVKDLFGRRGQHAHDDDPEWHRGHRSLYFLFRDRAVRLVASRCSKASRRLSQNSRYEDVHSAASLRGPASSEQ